MNSKKVQKHIVNDLAGLTVTLVNGRWAHAFFDIEEQNYGLRAGNDMLPADYYETHDDVDSLVKSMREIANLRRWSRMQYE